MAQVRGQLVQVSGRTLSLTNPDKLLYPAAGVTKGEVIAYYADIAPLLLPHLRDRPITRKRWPDGVDETAPAKVFFAKNLPPGTPDWVRRFSIDHSGGTNWYPVADEPADLVWLAQLAALELHVPQWRFNADGVPQPADRLVLDLDPGPGVSLAGCAEVASWVRGVLAEWGLETLPVTSGSKGIHLYARLPAGAEIDPAGLAKQVAEGLQAKHPERVTAVMRRADRKGKVFLDWSQNNRAKTTISPYSLRGRERPWAAAPRTWEELADPELRQLEFFEVLSRAGEFGDLLSPLLAPAAGSSQAVPKRPKRLDLPPASGDDPGAVPTRPLPRESIRAVESRQISKPMLASLAQPSRSVAAREWAFEMKWDGIRAIIEIESGEVQIYGRRGRQETLRFPELLPDLRALPCDQAVLDGEIVALDRSGAPSFELLQPRINLARPAEIEAARRLTPVQLVLFDLLSLNGHPLLAEPYLHRRTLLESLDPPAGARVQIPPAVPGELAEALQTSAALGLEGVVAKRLDSSYEPGRRSESWLKFKHQRTQSVVVVGWKAGQGSRAGAIGSLLLAIPGPLGLDYVGRVGSGFAEAGLVEAARRLEGLQRLEPALTVPLEDATEVTWVEPVLVGEVRYTERTSIGRLRNPVWLGWRADLGPREVAWE